MTFSLNADRKILTLLCIPLWLACSAFAALQVEAASSSRSITFMHGTLHGFNDAGVDRYLGIPYAKPPVGELRWQPAHAMDSVVGSIDATEFGPMCMQPTYDPVPVTEMNEDCLTLNVWKPADLDAPAPVMVWLHGGGFVYGHGRIPGEVLARYGVIVVSLNYRLGALGFFAHDSLDSDVANFGLTDAVAALSWVEENIPAFGGDPENVTILGNSGGGMMVNLLLVNEQAQPLFDKAISQSGYITWPIPTTRAKHERRVLDIDARPVPFAEDLGQEIVSRILPSQPTGQELRALDAGQLVNVERGFFRPIVDSVTLKDQPYRLIAQKSRIVPLITGGTSYEGSVMPFSGISIDEYLRSWCDQMDSLHEMYRDDFEVDDELGYRRAFGDERYIFSAHYLGQRWSEIEQSAWLYLVDLPHAGEEFGTSHGVDYRLLFHADTVENEALRKIGETLRRYWINFATNGDPNGESLPLWPPYSAKAPNWLVMGDSYSRQPVKATIMDILKQRLLKRQGLPTATQGAGCW